MTRSVTAIEPCLPTAPKQMFDVMFKETRADVVYRVPIKGSAAHIDFFVILEHKSFDDFWTIFQAFCYVARICEREFNTAKDSEGVNKSYRLPPVIAIIIHHGETRFTGSVELGELFYDLTEIRDFLPKMKAILVDLNIMEESAVPSDPNVPELKAVLMILKVIFSKEVGVKAKEIFEELKPYSDEPRYRYLIRLICVYLASSAKHLKNKYANLEQVIKTVTGEKEMSTLYELWTAEGRAEGEARGEVRGAALSVQSVLNARFHTVTPKVQKQLSAITDVSKLENLVGQAAVCPTLKDFEKLLSK
ncbi:MAG: Rpn family recombination-promoting nuclease/putative transposase [Planctomycetaceae bacterium]|jgi:hypothetical protein|nr:Rpn family recombination-promoting nuclease/putative transposase [Planctomycetaceae bacterium]